MALQLSQKEKQLLQDQQKHEQVCIEKYRTGAEKATDPQLKQLFQNYAQQEQTHYDTINSILNGQVPSMNQGQQSQQSQQPTMSNQQGSGTAQSSSQSSMQSSSSQSSSQTPSTSYTASHADAMMCNDMLMTEKYVSGSYDTTIFEFTDASVRQALNHIQKEEQQHGEGIYNYLSSIGQYSVQ